MLRNQNSRHSTGQYKNSIWPSTGNFKMRVPRDQVCDFKANRSGRRPHRTSLRVSMEFNCRVQISGIISRGGPLSRTLSKAQSRCANLWRKDLRGFHRITLASSAKISSRYRSPVLCSSRAPHQISFAVSASSAAARRPQA